jgi:hypothetical protein
MTKKQKDGDGVTPDPFDPASLRLSQDFGAECGVKKVLLKVPVRKPTRQEFVRVHPDPDYSLDTALIELKDDREFYLVPPELQIELFDETAATRLYTAVNRQGVITLWPCPLPGHDGRTNAWHETAIQAAELAKTRWVRVVSDMSLGGYQPFAAVAELPEPEWPDRAFGDLLRLAFGDRLIDQADHPVIKRLRGEI